MDEGAYKRAYKILKSMMECRNMSEDLLDMFHQWLLSGHNCEEKEAALQRIFLEFIDGHLYEINDEFDKKVIDVNKIYQSDYNDRIKEKYDR